MNRLFFTVSLVLLISFALFQDQAEAQNYKCRNCCQDEKQCEQKYGRNTACVFGNCVEPEDRCSSDSDCSGSIDCKNYGHCRCTHGQCS